MNNTQRNFLIKKIQEGVEIRMRALRDSMPEEPNLSNYLLHAVMSGKFDIISNEEIKEIIRQKALTSKQGHSSWMASNKGRYSAFGNMEDLVFKANEFFIIPEDYKGLLKEYEDRRDKINEEMATLSIQCDSLVTRITLASDKTLQTMINEVDDMGNISLIDTKLKLLS